jgi:8-oxo-dGTP diphosphatase
MTKSSKLVAIKQNRVLLVRRIIDGLWMFPGGKRKRQAETAKDCLDRELQEELPKLRVGRAKLWRKIKRINPFSGRKMSDAVYVSTRTAGSVSIGDMEEIDRAEWRSPWRTRLTPTSRFIRDKLFPRDRSR